jgi:hypothetical protein
MFVSFSVSLVRAVSVFLLCRPFLEVSEIIQMEERCELVDRPKLSQQSIGSYATRDVHQLCAKYHQQTAEGRSKPQPKVKTYFFPDFSRKPPLGRQLLVNHADGGARGPRPFLEHA